MTTTPAGTAIETVDYDQFVARRADPAVTVVDVLPVTTYRHSHIPRAINLPLAHVLELAPDLLPDRGREIILYCASFT